MPTLQPGSDSRILVEMGTILDGKALAQRVRLRLKEAVARFQAQHGYARISHRADWR